MVKTLGVVSSVAVLCSSVSCGSNDGEGDGPFGVGEIEGSSGASSYQPGLGPDGGTATQCMPGPDDEGCVGEIYAGETIPLDIYIMFDQSCSMSCPVETTGQPGQCCPGEPDPRIDPTLQALDEFLNDNQSAGIGVGIGYFGFMEVGSTSCDPDDYSQESVEIGLLPGHAEAVLESLYSVEPTGETPTGAAIRGACVHANEWRDQNPGHATVILLVTDGVPEAPSSDRCSPSVEDAADAARECLDGGSGLPTYVLGIGLALDNLNEIAAAGGTEAAYLVDGERDSVLEALSQIRSAAAIPCDMQIPPVPEGEVLNTREVNLGICDASGQVITTYYVDTPEQCGEEGGWFYDNPTNPARIILCDATCETVSIPGAQLYYSIGCQTQSIVE